MTSDTRTLMIHSGGIGDLLLAAPALASVATHTQLELAGIPERIALLHSVGIANAIHNLDAIHFHSIFAEPTEELTRFIRQFDHVYIFLRDDGTIADALDRIGVRTYTCFPGIPPEAWARHATEYYAECLGVEPDPTFRLHLTPRPGWDVAIHPGSGSKKKNWPRKNFEEIATRLKAAGHEVTWLAGPAEERNSSATHVESLVELGERLAAANLYIGNDSGITHLAATVGCPTLAIFGPTDPAVWAPQGDHVDVVRGKPWPSVNEVWSCIDKDDAL